MHIDECHELSYKSQKTIEFFIKLQISWKATTSESENWKMQLFIKTLIGPCFAIPCEETDTILELKQKMEKNYEEGMPPDQMRILWGGKQLEDDRTIKDYGLMHNTTLHICLRLRGGN
jgi:ubiquitin-large subunit ribosomal protein L40e